MWLCRQASIISVWVIAVSTYLSENTLNFCIIRVPNVKLGRVRATALICEYTPKNTVQKNICNMIFGYGGIGLTFISYHHGGGGKLKIAKNLTLLMDDVSYQYITVSGCYSALVRSTQKCNISYDDGSGRRLVPTFCGVVQYVLRCSVACGGVAGRRRQHAGGAGGGGRGGRRGARGVQRRAGGRGGRRAARAPLARAPATRARRRQLAHRLPQYVSQQIIPILLNSNFFTHASLRG